MYTSSWGEEKKDHRRELSVEALREDFKSHLYSEGMSLLCLAGVGGGLTALIFIISLFAQDNALISVMFAIPLAVCVVLSLLHLCLWLIARSYYKKGKFYLIEDRFSHSTKSTFPSFGYMFTLECFFQHGLLGSRNGIYHVYFKKNGELITDWGGAESADSAYYLAVLDNPERTVIGIYRVEGHRLTADAEALIRQ